MLRLTSHTVKPDLIATEVLAFCSKSSRNKHSDLTMRISYMRRQLLHTRHNRHTFYRELQRLFGIVIFAAVRPSLSNPVLQYLANSNWVKWSQLSTQNNAEKLPLPKCPCSSHISARRRWVFTVAKWWDVYKRSEQFHISLYLALFLTNTTLRERVLHSTTAVMNLSLLV